MTYCNACQCMEPRTREATEAERLELGISPDDTETGDIEVCAECDTLESLEYYSEDSPWEDR